MEIKEKILMEWLENAEMVDDRYCISEVIKNEGERFQMLLRNETPQFTSAELANIKELTDEIDVRFSNFSNVVDELDDNLCLFDSDKALRLYLEKLLKRNQRAIEAVEMGSDFYDIERSIIELFSLDTWSKGFGTVEYHLALDNVPLMYLNSLVGIVNDYHKFHRYLEQKLKDLFGIESSRIHNPKTGKHLSISENSILKEIIQETNTFSQRVEDEMIDYYLFGGFKEFSNRANGVSTSNKFLSLNMAIHTDLKSGSNQGLFTHIGRFFDALYRALDIFTKYSDIDPGRWASHKMNLQMNRDQKDYLLDKLDIALSILKTIEVKKFSDNRAKIKSDKTSNKVDNYFKLEDITVNEDAATKAKDILIEAGLIDKDTFIFKDKEGGGVGHFYSTILKFHEKGYLKRKPKQEEALLICENSFGIKISSSTAKNHKTRPGCTIKIEKFTIS